MKKGISKNVLKRIPKILLAAVVAFSLVWCLALSLPSCNKAGPRQYTVWLYSAQKTEYYKEYADNPVLKYLLNQDEWKGEQISFEFLVPPGDPQDSYNTMVTSGDFPTLMQNSVSDPAPVMYDNGYILDLTQLVQDYMPNYYNLIQTNSELKQRVVFDINGEEKILSLATLSDDVSYTYTGTVYRRDWIAKYGTNPSNGAAFTYSSGEGMDDWTDDVKFPSWYDETKKNFYIANVDAEWDGSSPVYISDWEWMFGIFAKAIKEQNIDNGYGTSIYYPGYLWAGGLNSCFGEGSVIWYCDSNGEVQFGGTEKSTEAYFECVNTWYRNGWVDKEFNERVGTQYFSIDTTSVRQGKVGMWQGLESDLGNRLDQGGNTDGIFVEGCALPINDLYGDEENKYVIPRTLNLDSSLVVTGFFLMKGAEEKELEPLLKFLDYFYTEEGAACRTLGLTEEEYNNSPDKSFYNSYGLQQGTYSKSDDGKYIVSDTILNDSGGLSIAASLDRLPGLNLVKNVDRKYADTYKETLDSWIQYKDYGRIWGSVAFGNMSSGDTSTASKGLSDVLAVLEAHAYNIIKSGSTINFKINMQKLNNALSEKQSVIDSVSAILQKYLNEYPIPQPEKKD